VQGIAEWIDLDNYLMEFNKNFFKNGARLNGVLETEMTTEEQLFNLKISFEEQYAGVKNAYKTVALPKGVKFTATQAQAKDMDFSNLAKETFDRVLAGFRVSRTVLGTAESDTNRATAETADYVFAKRTIKPKMQLIISYLNEFLVPRYADNIYLEFIDPVPEDTAARMVEMQTAVASKQVITQNEAREEFMGLGPVEGGDSIDTGLGGGIVLPPMKATKKVKSTNIKPSVKKTKTQFARNHTLRKEMMDSLGARIESEMKKIKEFSEDVRKMDAMTYEKEIISKENQRISEFQQEVIHSLRGVNDRQKKVVLDNLSKAIKAVDGSRLFKLDEWITLTVDALTPIFNNLFAKQGATAAEIIGQPALNVFDNDQNKKALNDAIGLLAQKYQESVVETLKTKIDEGLKEGAGIEDIKTRVQDIYQWQDEYAAERVARTEVVRVSNMANKAAWQDAGTVKTVMWYTSEKDNVCVFCSDMNGEIIDVSKDFFDKGDDYTVDGQSMSMDYSAIGGPPLHPNCGCYIRPDSFTPIE
jgi:SPP1 gp7 family putative phage head morphogenesis protein